MNKVPLIKPTLMGKKTIFKTDTIPTKGSNNIVTSDALAQALQDKVVNKEEEGEKTIVPTGDIIIGRLLENGFYIEDPTFLGTRLIKIETPTPGKFYYDKTTHTYYTFQGYSETGYNFKPVVLPNLTELTWQELKDLRDDSKLTPGSLYHITDYQCTTTQENTRSAGHQFDIVLLALSENKLAEEGWAMKHPTDVYDVTFADGITKKCWLYEKPDAVNLVDYNTHNGGSFALEDIIINEIDKTVDATDFDYDECMTDPNLPYNYFQNSNLSAWKVWYCLDNDKSRFAWADDSLDEGSPASVTGKDNTILYRNPAEDSTLFYAWTSESNRTLYTASETPNIGDDFLSAAGDPSAKYGTVISFTPAQEGTGLPNGRGVIYRLIDEFNNDIKYDFKNIQFKRTITNGQYDANGTETWCYTLNLWYNECLDASIVGNIFSDDENMVKGVYNNVIGYTTVYDAWYYTIHSFAFALGNNVILSMGEPHDYLGICCNKIGDYSFNNTIDGSPYDNTIGNGFVNNIIGYLFERNNISNDFEGNTISGQFDDNIISNHFRNNTIGFGFKDNEIGDSFVTNIVGVQFVCNETGKVVQNCHFGNQFYYNHLGNDINCVEINKDNVYYIRIEDGVKYVNLTTNASGSGNLQNIIIGKGVKGESPRNLKVITHPTLNDTKQTTYLPTDSTTVNV